MFAVTYFTPTAGFFRENVMTESEVDTMEEEVVRTRVPVFLVHAPDEPNEAEAAPATARAVLSSVWEPARPLMVIMWPLGMAPEGLNVQVMVLAPPLVRLLSAIVAVDHVLVPPRTEPVKVLAAVLGVAVMAEMVGTAADLPVAGFFSEKVITLAAVVAIAAEVVRTIWPLVWVQAAVLTKLVPVTAMLPSAVWLLTRPVRVTVAPEAKPLDGWMVTVMVLAASLTYEDSPILLTSQQAPPAPMAQSVKIFCVES